ncbi:hypothetical protein Acsp07_55850 [Actinomycetospora sp. NBRC 106378]|nr:hypothetical protein Acsp07_55850 [Actinomycetospora sp. NBRC 106378]
MQVGHQGAQNHITTGFPARLFPSNGAPLSVVEEKLNESAPDGAGELETAPGEEEHPATRARAATDRTRARTSRITTSNDRLHATVRLTVNGA